MSLRLEIASHLLAYLLLGWRGVLFTLLARVALGLLLTFLLGRLAEGAERLADRSGL